MRNINAVLGEFFRSKRISESLTGIEVAKKMSVSQQQISRYERGVCSLSIETILRYCEVLDISPKELMVTLFPSEKIIFE
ncbi:MULTISPECIES: helix-turn-helix domain-containing protein [Providencia]|uniref:helix-turn-helix domain-containing protein n=1 Tax=Providencia TaxID=586 RepID=UPI000447A819|nr:MULTISPECIES: helix-turn-helix transcriptional regulator [Providencia]EUD06287.1 DNA-binding helix-turn-helix protein [Providencia alcalifaciens R90-1475]URQ57257.1 Hypothetical protein [Providencia alcalifaciens]